MNIKYRMIYTNTLVAACTSCLLCGCTSGAPVTLTLFLLVLVITYWTGLAPQQSSIIVFTFLTVSWKYENVQRIYIILFFQRVTNSSFGKTTLRIDSLNHCWLWWPPFAANFIESLSGDGIYMTIVDMWPEMTVSTSSTVYNYKSYSLILHSSAQLHG
jgi:uncharacterized protein (TIGR03382 family)